MMNQIEAIYENGVFKPLGEVGLPENERVRLSIEPLAGSDMLTWLAGVKHLHERIIAERGYLPDSTPDIAEDRMRDM